MANDSFINMICKIPRDVNLAFSGGVDSLAIAHFLRNNHNVTLLHFNHGCEYSNKIASECIKLAESLHLPIIVEKISDVAPKPRQSLEDFWRRARYKFLRSFDNKFITCHHLDDAVETWLWSSMHGQSKLIPHMDDQVLRPFLGTRKSAFVNYADKHGLIAVDDPFNRDYSLTRNYIRENIIQHAEVVNPGIYKVIRKKYLAITRT